MQPFAQSAHPMRFESWRFGSQAPFFGTGPYGYPSVHLSGPSAHTGYPSGFSSGPAFPPSGYSSGYAPGQSDGSLSAMPGQSSEYPARQPYGGPHGQSFGPFSGPFIGSSGYPGFFNGGIPFPGAVQSWPIGWLAGHPAYRAAYRQPQPDSPSSENEDARAAAVTDGQEPPDDEQRQPRDYGPNPFVTDIGDVTERNRAFRSALWTGTHLQLVLMSIPAGEEIGLERHENADQFIRIEEGRGLVQMGNSADNLDFRRYVEEDDVILIPAGTWHNLTNTGQLPLKLYTLYAPPQHPRGTVHATKQEAMAAEG